MLNTNKEELKLSERIAIIKAKMILDNKKLNKTQEFFEKVYKKTTQDIVQEYSTHNDNWGLFIDIGD